MRPLYWGIAAGIATGIALAAKKAKAEVRETMPSFDPTQHYGETTVVALAVPSGWRRVTNAEVQALPELAAAASALRNSAGFTSLPYGTLAPFVASDGNTYATWVEQHHHEPGGVIKPWGYHHGVTLLASTA